MCHVVCPAQCGHKHVTDWEEDWAADGGNGGLHSAANCIVCLHEGRESTMWLSSLSGHVLVHVFMHATLKHPVICGDNSALANEN